MANEHSTQTTTSSTLSREEQIKAAARAYALSNTTTKTSKSKKRANTTMAAAINNNYRRPPTVPMRTYAHYIQPAHPPPKEGPVQMRKSSGAGAALAVGTSTVKASQVGQSSAMPALPLPIVGGDEGQHFVADQKSLDEMDDYELFMKSLGLDSVFKEDDDEEEFQLDAIEDEEEEDEDDDDEDVLLGEAILQESQDDKVEPSVASPPHFNFPEMEMDFYKELEEELGWLEEEDMEAAVATLLDHPKKKQDVDTIEMKEKAETEKSSKAKPTPDSASSTPDMEGGTTVSPSTPLRDAARASRTVVTPEQYDQLRELMEKHFQLLLQQTVLAVRGAHFQRMQYLKDRGDFLSGGETADDLVEILDGAVGMIQDLEQNRKDAIRHSIQFQSAHTTSTSPRRSLFTESTRDASNTAGERRLTRAQFTKTLREYKTDGEETVFDVEGIGNVNDTFSMIDTSVKGLRTGSSNILELESNADACRQVLDQCGAQYDNLWIPGIRDASENFVEPAEFLGDKFQPPCTKEQEQILRRNRNLFTSGEDNLVIRGVNLYGEKQWTLISDRFLPDRSDNIISQRYSKLCVMIYKAHGIQIDRDGNLENPPKLNSPDDLDEEKVSKLKKVEPPAVLNVHRWSLEEDLTLLKAVPLMGSMWAELRARLIPHRDRGHLRKRYQVLERRVRGAVTRMNKHENVVVFAKANAKKVGPRPPGYPHHHDVHYPPQPTTSRTVVSSKSVNQAAAILAGARAAHSPVKPYHPPSDHYPPPHHSSYPYASPRKQPFPPPSKMCKTDENSRAAFESLVHDTTGEWSQLSRVKQMMELDTESMVASAIVTQLAKSPAKVSGDRETTMDSFPTVDLEASNMTFLDSLHDSPAKKLQTSKKSDKDNSISLLAGVLERSKQSEKSNSSKTDSKVLLSNDDGMMKPPPTPSKYASPKKRKAGATLLATPSRPYPYPPRTPTTAFSPGFRPGMSPGWAGMGSPALTLGSFPEGSYLFATDGNSLFDDDNNNNNTSRKTGDSPNKQLLMEANDLEAISALNSLSNSPSRVSGPQLQHRKRPQPTSLFSQVMEGATKKEETEDTSSRKKRKL